MNTLRKLLAVVFLLSPMAVNATGSAITISTSVGDYEVTLVEGTYDDLSATLETQIWYGDETLAIEFAGLVQDKLGMPFGSPNSYYLGPFFVYGQYAPISQYFFSSWSMGSICPPSGCPGVGSYTLGNSFGPYVFAVASRVTLTPELLLEQLQTTVTGIGTGTSLADKIMLAQTYLAVPDEESACLILGDFLNQVRAQRGKKLTEEQADQFTADAVAIMNAIGCD